MELPHEVQLAAKEIISNSAQTDMECLAELLTTAHAVHATNPDFWYGMDLKINLIVTICEDFLFNEVQENSPIAFLSLVRAVGELTGYIDGYTRLGRENRALFDARMNASDFGCWMAFDDDFSDDYFMTFTPLLRKFMLENGVDMFLN